MEPERDQLTLIPHTSLPLRTHTSIPRLTPHSPPYFSHPSPKCTSWPQGACLSLASPDQFGHVNCFSQEVLSAQVTSAFSLISLKVLSYLSVFAQAVYSDRRPSCSPSFIQIPPAGKAPHISTPPKSPPPHVGAHRSHFWVSVALRVKTEHLIQTWTVGLWNLFHG